ncbi:hypothetical protein ONZ45_g17616 [Pleurotus djamor]|nr:hypothetical protein ONZ45_g17616 [Pleurotus djamor]
MTSSADTTRASVAHLMRRTLSLPCSNAAQAFSQLVQPTMRFQVALDALLPILESSTTSQHPNDARISELPQRILASYILYYLYAPYPISINPFKTSLFDTFVKERHIALAGSSVVGSNEQLVWVLWKILKGDGNDIAPYSPSTLARSPLPPKLQVANLMLSEDDLADEAIPLHLGNGNIPTSKTVTPHVSGETDSRKEEIARAMSLLLAGKQRVLTLAEQKFLNPLLPALTLPPTDTLTSTPSNSTNGRNILLTSSDLAPIVAHNPTLAYSLIVALLSNPPPTRVSVAEASTPTTDHDLSPTRFLDVLLSLPPSFPSFDLIGRLVRDTTLIPVPNAGPNDEQAPKTTVADLVRTEYLGPFIHSCIEQLDLIEREEKEGMSSEDKWATGVRYLCRFFQSLIKLAIVDPASDADSAEMAHFSLRNARLEEAMSLYRVFAMANSDKTDMPAF